MPRSAGKYKTSVGICTLMLEIPLKLQTCVDLLADFFMVIGNFVDVQSRCHFF